LSQHGPARKLAAK